MADINREPPIFESSEMKYLFSSQAELKKKVTTVVYFHVPFIQRFVSLMWERSQNISYLGGTLPSLLPQQFIFLTFYLIFFIFILKVYVLSSQEEVVYGEGGYHLPWV